MSQLETYGFVKAVKANERSVKMPSTKFISCNDNYSISSCPVNEVGLSRGEMVIVSAENKPLIALTQGTIQDISDNDVSLALDR